MTSFVNTQSMAPLRGTMAGSRGCCPSRRRSPCLMTSSMSISQRVPSRCTPPTASMRRSRSLLSRRMHVTKRWSCRGDRSLHTRTRASNAPDPEPSVPRRLRRSRACAPRSAATAAWPVRSRRRRRRSAVRPGRPWRTHQEVAVLREVAPQVHGLRRGRVENGLPRSERRRGPWLSSRGERRSRTRCSADPPRAGDRLVHRHGAAAEFRRRLRAIRTRGLPHPLPFSHRSKNAAERRTRS